MSLRGLRLSSDHTDTPGTGGDAKVIARQLSDAGLEDEELFNAMWEQHDRTGLEARHIFAEYQALVAQPVV
ncbi:MAG: hypothetical protein JWR01_2953 [Subtercola sp.]|nr:hypothetical protein [Subtercola sp.]